jgi:2-keto-4-pentenoate hydratase/2-oxohepta-3-ene-1,7-dioic acid hydratase in catechol pathway
MKLLRCRTKQGEIAYGAVQTDGSVLRVIGSPFGAYSVVSEKLAVDRILSPVDPTNIICIGLNYRKHAEESKMPIPTTPVIFFKNSAAACNPEDLVPLPHMNPDQVDYECELAIVIGRPARNVKAQEAAEYVAGYTCANDVSARDAQFADNAKQWCRGKSFDRFCPLGPYLVKGDGFNPDNAGIRTRLNGQVMQDSNTNDLIFSTGTVIEYLSHSFTLVPGTVILTGTPFGVGVARNPQVFLKPGDVVEIEIDGIGTLKNTIVKEEKPA